MAQARLIYQSPLGAIELLADGAALTALRFADGAAALASADGVAGQPVLSQAVRWLDRYFAGRDPGATPPVRLLGTIFQQTVWRELLTIPRGHTITYGELAWRLGCLSARAVGQAVGRNPVAIIVPCHRVVGAGGVRGGYAYGPDRKQRLLDLETKNTAP